MSDLYLLLFAGLMLAGFALGRWRAQAVAGGRYAEMHSLPSYHGLFVVCGVFAPMLAIFVIGTPLTASSPPRPRWRSCRRRCSEPLRASTAFREVASLVAGRHVGEASAALKVAAAYAEVQRGARIVLGAGLAAGLLALAWVPSRISMPRAQLGRAVRRRRAACVRRRRRPDHDRHRAVGGDRNLPLFLRPGHQGRPGVFDFLFGTEWNPQAALRADQGDIQTAYGFLPLLVGTLLITAVAIGVAGPLGLMSAIYLAEYASPRLRSWAKPVLEILAGIPTVVLGFRCPHRGAVHPRLGHVARARRRFESALAAGLVMGMMIISFVVLALQTTSSTLCRSRCATAPTRSRDQVETLKQVEASAALPGIVSAFMLAISRAIGETMIVVMARAGRQPDDQPARGGDHDHRPDQDDPRRRPGVRQRQDARRLRARLRPVLHHARPQLHRAARGATLP